MAHSGDARPSRFGRWLSRGLSWLLSVVLAFVAGAVVMHVGMHAGDHERLQALEQEVATQAAAAAQARYELLAAQARANLRAGSEQALKDAVADLQATLAKATEQVAFYEQLLPPGPAGSVAIRALDVRDDGPYLHYRVLLSRHAASDDDLFRGRLRFMVSDASGDQPVTLELPLPDQAVQAPPDGADAPRDPRTLEFNRFQRSEGVLAKPVPDIRSVRLDVLEGDRVRASRHVEVSRHSAERPGVSDAEH